MCGIAGLHHWPVSPIEIKSHVERMCASIIHRGPDDMGVFVERAVGLGMRRLSIIDVSGGHQPIQNEDRSVTVVFNGEIYNYKALRAWLVRCGHTFRTQSDTEVIVHAYEEEGLDCVKRFNGIFAFAIWDTRRQRLFLARDRMGIKPLYYVQQGEQLAFASEIKALLTLSEVPRTLDLEATFQFFRLGFVPSPRTLFQGVHKLPPGFRLVMEGGKVRREQYWDFNFEKIEPLPSFEECCSQLRDLLRNVVTEQMVSDVPIGAFLSGGVDSSAVVAFMKEAATNGVRTYSIGFDQEHAYHNEAPFAEAVSQHFQTRHKTVIAKSHVADLLPMLIEKLDEPLTDTSFLVTYQVSELAKRDVKVVLSGLGGDELFGGYRRYWAPDIHKATSWIPPIGRKLLGKTLAGVLWANRGSVIGNMGRYSKAMGQTLHLPLSEQYLNTISVLSTEQVVSLFRRPWGIDDPTSELTQLYNQPSTSTPLDRLLYVDAKTVLPESLLLLSDRMGMAASLEVRVPLLDNRVVDFVSKLPNEYRLRGLMLKRLLKASLKGVVPDFVLTRSKRGFGTPMGAWLQGELRPMVDELLDEARLKKKGLFNHQFIKAMRTSHESGKEDFTEPILALMTFQIWLDQFRVSIP